MSNLTEREQIATQHRLAENPGLAMFMLATLAELETGMPPDVRSSRFYDEVARRLELATPAITEKAEDAALLFLVGTVDGVRSDYSDADYSRANIQTWHS